MKTNILKFSFVLSILLIGITSCSKDEFSTDGKLSVSFINHPDDLVVAIYSVDNSEIPIYELTPNEDGKISITINVGNYILIPRSGTFYPRIGFQIIQDKTTSVSFDNNNKPTRN